MSDTKETVLVVNEDKPKPRRGRPPKALVESKKAGKRGQVGRPKGDAAAINEFKARILASPKSQRVVETILDAALNDDHKNQAAAWKILMDRMLPLSYFDKEKEGGGRPSVNITISGIGSEVQTSNVIDIEGEAIEDDESGFN